MKTPLKSVRQYCIKECCIYQPREVLKCPAKDCVFWKFRLGKGRVKVKDIRARCKDCGEGTAFAIRNCGFPDCPLYPYRLGTNPARAGQGGNGRRFSKETCVQKPK
jgi:hypothetical protein